MAVASGIILSLEQGIGFRGVVVELVDHLRVPLFDEPPGQGEDEVSAAGGSARSRLNRIDLTRNGRLALTGRACAIEIRE